MDDLYGWLDDRLEARLEPLLVADAPKSRR